MKKTLLFALILSAISHSLCAQNLQKTQEPKRHSLTVSAGVYSKNFVIGHSSSYLNLKFGPMASLDYRYKINDYLSIRGKIFSGSIDNNDENQVYWNHGLSAGIIVTPFGERLSSFKIGFSPTYIFEYAQFQTLQINGYYAYWWGLEIPMQLYIFDKASWGLAIGCDIRFGHYYDDGGNHKTLSITPMLSYSVKF